MRYESFKKDYGFKEGQILSFYKDGERIKGKFKFTRGSEDMPAIYLELENGDLVFKRSSELF